MPGISTFPAAGGIKSIQYFSKQLVDTTGFTGTATITSVDTTKSVLIMNGAVGTTTGNAGDLIAAYVLTNATTVTITRSNVGVTATFYGVVVEYY